MFFNRIPLSLVKAMRCLVLIVAIGLIGGSRAPPKNLQEALPVHVGLMREAADLVNHSDRFLGDSLAYMSSHGEEILGPEIYASFVGLLYDTRVELERFGSVIASLGTTQVGDLVGVSSEMAGQAVILEMNARAAWKRFKSIFDSYPSGSEELAVGKDYWANKFENKWKSLTARATMHSNYVSALKVTVSTTRAPKSTRTTTEAPLMTTLSVDELVALFEPEKGSKKEQPKNKKKQKASAEIVTSTTREPTKSAATTANVEDNANVEEIDESEWTAVKTRKTNVSSQKKTGKPATAKKDKTVTKSEPKEVKPNDAPVVSGWNGKKIIDGFRPTTTSPPGRDEQVEARGMMRGSTTTDTPVSSTVTTTEEPSTTTSTTAATATTTVSAETTTETLPVTTTVSTETTTTTTAGPVTVDVGGYEYPLQMASPGMVLYRPAVDPMVRELCLRAQALGMAVVEMGVICQNIGAYSVDQETYARAERLLRRVNHALRAVNHISAASEEFVGFMDGIPSIVVPDTPVSSGNNTPYSGVRK